MIIMVTEVAITVSSNLYKAIYTGFTKYFS